jgi:hypothetical protein
VLRQQHGIRSVMTQISWARSNVCRSDQTAEEKRKTNSYLLNRGGYAFFVAVHAKLHLLMTMEVSAA